jgi:hypothetical protein
MARTNFREAMKAAGRVAEGRRQTTEPQSEEASPGAREGYEQEAGNG